MERSDPWVQLLAERFAAGFPADPLDHRTVGRESEHPLVLPDGSAGDLAALWPVLQELAPELQSKSEPSGLTVELTGPRFQIVAEVGRGTVELVVGPHHSLLETAAAHLEGLRLLQEAAMRVGQRVLGYGIQPLTPPSRELMTAKQRYGALHEVIGDDWLSFALTASDQVHAAISRGELVLQTTIGHLLTPAHIALCANSPVAGGEDQGVCSTREARMGRIGAAEGRHGLPLGPDADVADMIRRYVNQPWLIRYEGPGARPCTGRFADRLASAGAPTDGLDAEVWSDFLTHEHYIWNSARPRSRHGTVELRAACQQPLGESMAAAAFGVAVACSAGPLALLLEDRLGDEAWPVMVRWHGAAVREGLGAPPPVNGLLEEILVILQQGLNQRGLGEGVLLQPLFDRLQRGRCPAQDARAVFARGGMAALVDHAAR